MYPEKQYHRQETAKEYTKVYTLDNNDQILIKQDEDGMLGYINVQTLKSFTRNYGAFSDSTSQSGSTNTAYAMKLNTTDLGGHGVSVVSGSRMTVENSGVYNLQFSAQLDRVAGSGTKDVSIWLSVTGSNVVNTSTIITMSGGAKASATVAAWNFLVPLSSSQYCELMWSTQDANLHLTASGSMSSPDRPSVPSVIATLTQVS